MGFYTLGVGTFYISCSDERMLSVLDRDAKQTAMLIDGSVVFNETTMKTLRIAVASF